MNIDEMTVLKNTLLNILVKGLKNLLAMLASIRYLNLHIEKLKNKTE